MSRFLIACGGTGGHLAPGIALADELIARGHACRLLVSSRDVDARLSRKYGHLDFSAIPGAGFSIHPARLVRFVTCQARGMASVRRVIRGVRPDVAVGFGGFTTAALAFAARPAGVPLALHEANRVPGRAIRLAGSFAQRVYLPPGVRRPGLPATVVRHCGVPVRREMARHPRAKACVELGLDPKRKTLVVLGGSQGARVLNEWAEGAVVELAREGVELVCVTGPNRLTAGSVESTAADGRKVRAVFMPFCDDMATLLSAAHLVVSRAGAGTIAELVRMNVPALLVPFPHAADHHQEANARFFEQQGGGFTIGQGFIGDLTREVIEVLFNDWLMQQFRHNLRRMDRADPAGFMANDLEAIARAGSFTAGREAALTA